MKTENDTCIVCANLGPHPVFLRGSKHHPHYVRCRSCGFVFASPRVPYDYRRESFFKGWHTDEFSIETRLDNFNIRLEAISKHHDVPSSRFLDIGAHDGLFLKLVSSKGAEGLGLELNKSAADFARKIHAVDVRNETLENFSPSNTFDVVTLFNVFEHFEDPLSALREIRRITKINGILAMEVPHVFTPQARIFRGRWHHFQPQHFWFYDPSTITRLLEEQGFSVLECSFVPKVVNLSRPVWLLAAKLGLFRKLRNGRERFRNSWLFKFLDNRRIQMNFSEYLYVVARRKAELRDPGTIIDLSSVGALGQSPQANESIVRH